MERNINLKGKKDSVSASTSINETPKGKVSCLLCRRFISYKNSDRTIFRDHLANEHDVKFDSDVILAISVMTAKEKQHIIQCAMARLNEISNNQIPVSGESLLPKPAVAPTIPAPIQGQISGPPNVRSQLPLPVRGRGQPGSGGQVTSRGGRGAYRGTVIRPQRPAAPQQKVQPASAPFNIQNMSISISVVDQTVKCSQCTMTFKNSNLLAEHTKTVHLARFASLGLSITAPGEKKGQESSITQSPGANKRPRQQDSVRTPPAKVIVQGRGGRGGGRGRGSVIPASTRVIGNQVKVEPTSATNVTQTKTVATDKVDPVIKCNDCAQFIKQSIFKDHKLGHLKEKEANSINNGDTTTNVSAKSNRRKEDKQVDYVDLGEVSDEEEITDVTKKKVLEKTLPCPSCDVMFATTMSLKMHINLSHPVKAEATETEQLLSENDNLEDNDDSDEKVRDELNSVGTSEMLDDLVNFLNEL